MADLISGLGGPVGFGRRVERNQPNDFESLRIDIRSVFPDGINFFGATRQNVYLEPFGGIEFDIALLEDGPGSTPQRAFGSFFTRNGIYGLYEDWAWYADVDAAAPSPGGTSRGTNAIYVHQDPDAGAITITWDDVRTFVGADSPISADAQNAFQLRLVNISDRPGRAPGDVRVELRYEQVDWIELPIENYVDVPPFVGVVGGDAGVFWEAPASRTDAVLNLDLRPVRSVEIGLDGLYDITETTYLSDGRILRGTSGADLIEPSSDSARVLPGLGRDEIDMLSFELIVSGSADELFGDTLSRLSKRNILYMRDVALDPGDITFGADGRALRIDLDGDGAPDGAMRLKFPDLDPDAVAPLTFATGNGTFFALIDRLPEPVAGVALEAPEFTGYRPPVERYLQGGETSDFILRVDAAMEGHAIGVYSEARRFGTLSDVELLTPEARAGQSFVLDDVRPGDQLSVFVLRPDDPGQLDADAFEFVDARGETARVGSGPEVRLLADGEAVAGEIVHSLGSPLNPIDPVRVFSGARPGVDGLSIAFDTDPAADGDFADVVVSIERVAADLL